MLRVLGLPDPSGVRDEIGQQAQWFGEFVEGRGLFGHRHHGVKTPHGGGESVVGIVSCQQHEVADVGVGVAGLQSQVVGAEFCLLPQEVGTTGRQRFGTYYYTIYTKS